MDGNDPDKLFLNQEVVNEELRKAELATIVASYQKLTIHDKAFLAHTMWPQGLMFIDRNPEMLDFIFTKCKDSGRNYMNFT